MLTMSSLLAPEIVIMTTSGTTVDDKFASPSQVLGFCEMVHINHMI